MNKKARKRIIKRIRKLNSKIDALEDRKEALISKLGKHAYVGPVMPAFPFPPMSELIGKFFERNLKDALDAEVIGDDE